MTAARWAALAVAAAGVLAVGLGGYLMPTDASSGWWLNPPAAEHYRGAVPFTDRLPVLGLTGWRWYFRAALLVAWAGYGGLVWAVGKCSARGATGTQTRWLEWTAAAVPVLVAVFAPPVLSSDVYSYAMDGRMTAVYEVNPYSVSQANPQPRADEAARFAAHDYPPPYGPVWVGLAVAVAAAVPGLFAQVTALKLVQAAALIAAGRVAKGIGGEAARFAVLLNPLLVIEGAGSGHNDPLMAAALLAAVAAWRTERWTLAGALVGVAAGVKVLPVAVLPWLGWLAYRGGGWKRSAWVVLAAVGVLVAAYLPFAPGGRFLDGLAATAGQSATDEQRAEVAEQVARLVASGVPPPVAGVLVAAWGKKLALIGWLAATVWAVRSPHPAAWIEGWAAFALALAFAANGRSYPWYLCWPLVPVLAGAVRHAKVAGVAGCMIGFVLQLLYTHDW